MSGSSTLTGLLGQTLLTRILPGLVLSALAFGVIVTVIVVSDMVVGYVTRLLRRNHQPADLGAVETDPAAAAAATGVEIEPVSEPVTEPVRRGAVRRTPAPPRPRPTTVRQTRRVSGVSRDAFPGRRRWA